MATIRQRKSKTTGQLSYLVEVRLKGYPPQTATFSKLTEARAWAKNTEVDIKQGRHFKTAEAKKHTFGDMVDRYIKSVLPKKSKVQATKQKMQLEWFKERLGPHTLADVTPALIVKCRDELADGTTYRHSQRSPTTVVRYLSALSHCYGVAVTEWCWLERIAHEAGKKAP